MQPDVELYFDPVCPFCWQTSKWLRQVQRIKGLAVGYRFISLRMLNEPIGYDDAPAAYEQVHVQGTRLLRVCAATRRAHGNGSVEVLYQQLGQSLWEIDPPDPAGGFDAILEVQAEGIDIEAALTAADLPTSLAEAADTETYDQLIREETDAALERAGSDVGTPILSFDPPDGPAFFGPVISDLPDDETAVDYYESIRKLANWRGFAELKRSLRTMPDTKMLAGLRDGGTES